MMKKRLTAVLLAGTMVFGAFAGCGKTDPGTGSGGSSSQASSQTSSQAASGSSTAEESSAGAPSGNDLAFKKFDEPVEVHIGMSVSPTDTTLPAGDTPEDNQYTRYLLENYNIKIVVDWTAAEGNDYNQKVSLAIASNSLPDGLVANDQTYLRKAVKSGQLKDISALFDQYASSQVKEITETTGTRAIDSVSFDGGMYALPNISVDADGVHVMFIRQDWLDDLNLEVPTTVSEIEEVAKAFQQAKPAGDKTIPIAGPNKSSYLYATFLTSSNNSYGFDPIFQAYDAYPGYWLDNGDGTVSYGTLSENTKKAMTTIQSWYQQGLIDPEMGTRDTTSEIVNANQVGIYFGPWWSLGYGNLDAFKNDPTTNWQAYPVYSDDGKWNVHMKSVGTTSCMINKNASDDVTAAMIIMYNALVRDEGIFDTSVAIGWYPLRVVASPADECEHEYKELTKILDGETTPADYDDDLSPYKLMRDDANKLLDAVKDYEKGAQLGVDNLSYSENNPGTFQRFYALLIGDRPYATIEPDKKVFSVTYSMTDTMERKWSNLKKMEDEMALKLATGQSDVNEFEAFVANWKSQGGDDITKEVESLLG